LIFFLLFAPPFSSLPFSIPLLFSLFSWPNQAKNPSLKVRMEFSPEVVQAARRRRREAWAQLAEKLRPYVLSCLKSRLSAFDFYNDGQDLASEILLRIWRNLPELEKPESFKAWVNLIIRRSLIDYYYESREREIPFASLSEELEELL